jgi:hypothetical protein
MQLFQQLKLEPEEMYVKPESFYRANEQDKQAEPSGASAD